jgi:L-cysteine/cystine lyase
VDEKLARIREQLPAVQAQVYLNTGTSGPLPRQVRAEMVRSLEAQEVEGRIGLDYFPQAGSLRGELRQALAQLLGCDATEVALTQSTTEGMNMVTLGINWRPGDEAITTNLEHPGALFPLYAARERFGITVKVANVADRPEGTAAVIDRLITPRTKLISLSHVSFITGAVLPVKEICAVAHRHGVRVLVDGAQSFAATPVNVRDLGADFYAVPGQKWLCGPEGTGALYASQDAVSEVQITFAGYFSVDGYNIHGGILPKGNAQKFEQGMTQPAMLAGQLAACHWLTDEVGPGWAFGRIRELALTARDLLSRVPGVTVVTTGETAGLITFQVSGVKAEEAAMALARQGILVRTVPHPQAIRLATGFYNTVEELERLAAALGAMTAGHA